MTALTRSWFQTGFQRGLKKGREETKSRDIELLAIAYQKESNGALSYEEALEKAKEILSANNFHK